MRNAIRFGVFGAAALCVAACSRGPEAITTVAPEGPPAELSAADTNFLNAASIAGKTEIEFGKLAASKASRPSVRQFGQHMVDEHTRMDQQLSQIAQNKRIAPAEAMNAAHA